MSARKGTQFINTKNCDLSLRTLIDLIVEVLFACNSNKAEEYPSKRFSSWSKITFKSHDIKLLSL